MPSEPEAVIDLKKMQESAGPYPLEAFEFVRRGLGHTTTFIHADRGGLEPGDRHVTGQQLCLGLLDYALDRYGMLAPAVMNRWNVQRTDDFGRIVYALIDAGVMNKTASDTMEHFRSVYDFAEVFSKDAMRRRLLTRNS